jgi:hypothetical protein
MLCFVLAVTAVPTTASAFALSQIDWRNVQAEEVDATLTPDINITLDGRKLDLLNDRGD